MLKTSEANHVLSFGEAIRKEVALELSASFPIPFRQKEALGYRAFYYHLGRTNTRRTFEVYPPGWLAAIHASDGALIELTFHDPAFYGLHAKPNETMGTHHFDYSYDLDEVEQKNDELYALADKLIPAWRTKATADRHLARDFREIFTELTATPLLPCYQKLSDFFSWVGL